MPVPSEIDPNFIGFLDAFKSHVESDEKLHAEMRVAFTEGLSGLRLELRRLTDMVEFALRGDTKDPGLTERIRSLEKALNTFRWAAGVLFVAVAGLGVQELWRWFGRGTP